MPVAAATDAADRIPDAWVEVVDGAGHFVWVEAPGAVRASRFVASQPRALLSKELCPL
jgi:pimeloyl-ACP methyl ester carboxylesterase